MTIKDVKHPRIVCTADTLFGRPWIDGTRITVEHILRRLAAAWSFEEIVDQHPRMTTDDIRAALEFAADHMGRSASETVDAAE